MTLTFTSTSTSYFLAVPGCRPSTRTQIWTQTGIRPELKTGPASDPDFFLESHPDSNPYPDCNADQYCDPEYDPDFNYDYHWCTAVWHFSPVSSDIVTLKTRCKTKQSWSVAYPLIPLAACWLLLIGQLIGSPASIESGDLFACAEQCATAAVAVTDESAPMQLAQCRFPGLAISVLKY